MPDHVTQPTTLLLCRHGESVWNLQGRAQGQHPDAPGLTDLGRQQARLLAQRLAALGVDALYSSDLRRATETATFVADALNLEPVIDTQWREIGLGGWEGLTRAEVAHGWPETIAAVARGEDPPRGGGETYAQLAARTGAAAHRLVRRHPGQRVAVVCHGGNIRSLLLTLPLPDGAARPRDLPIVNTSLTVVAVNSDGSVVCQLPDSSHLNGLQPRNQDFPDDRP